jgi:predicted RNA binding protein YcfA (HicA-like mRNA interferase family)
LPGCYSQGESVSELRDNVREPIAGVLDVIKDQGRQPESNIRIRGSHHIYAKASEPRILSIPEHGNRNLKPGLASRIAGDADIGW